MDQDFMNRLIPRIHDIVFRDEQHWRNNAYQVEIPATRMCNLGLALGGTGKLTVNGEEYDLRRGCFYHISPPRSRMRFISDRDNPLLYIAIHFDYRLVHWEGTELASKEADTAIPLPHVLQLEAEADAEEQFRNLYSLWNGKEPGYEWRSRNLLLELLDGIESRHATQSLAIRRAEEAVRRAMEHVHTQYRQPADRYEVARSCSMSVSYFSLLFKKITGYSYVNYVQKVRVDHAKALLRNGLAPISEIADKVGYSDPLYFSKLFSREVGMSPREYRRG